MICCYIIYSKKLDRFYIGALQGDLEARIRKHNDHAYGEQRFTAKANDWEIFLLVECEIYAQAIRIERHIKKTKSSKYIRNLRAYPEMVEKLKSRFIG